MYSEWMEHDSQQLFYRVPFGAVSCGTEVSLRLNIDLSYSLRSVFLRLWKNDREERVIMQQIGQQGKYKTFECRIQAPLQPGLMWYYFILEGEETFYYGNGLGNWGGVGRITREPPESYQITVHQKEFHTPEWFKDAILYQIFVDRFYNGNEEGRVAVKRNDDVLHTNWSDQPNFHADAKSGKYSSNDFFGGNLKGIIKKLPYLKELGINTMYLNPIFDATSNHKYDVGDYKKIDAMFGDNEIFQELCKSAKEMGISILLDGVFSHTGSDSVYFNKLGNYSSVGAFQSPASLYYSWYRFKQYPDRYDCWWDILTLPNINEVEPSYQDFIMNDQNSVVKQWLHLGAKGWRLDVADELPAEFLKNFRACVKETDPEAVIIGEVWEDASHKISYGKMREYLLGNEVDSVMNYPFRRFLLRFFLEEWDADQLHKGLMSLYENYPLESFYSTMNLVDGHDVTRIQTRVSGAPEPNSLSREQQSVYHLTLEQKQLAKRRVMMISLFQMTFPGVPSIFYGDEAGVNGYGDPFCRSTYPWGKEDVELLLWYKNIIMLRKNMDMLRTGSFTPVYHEGEVYAFVRCIVHGQDVFGKKRNDGFALLLFNRSREKSYMVSIDISAWQIKSLMLLLVVRKECIPLQGMLTLEISPLQAQIWVDATAISRLS